MGQVNIEVPRVLRAPGSSAKAMVMDPPTLVTTLHVMTPCEDGSGWVAAIVSAVASRLRDASSTSDHNHKMQLDNNNKS